MALRNPTPGLVVDSKYRLAERIGGGGMGEVYRAENVLAGRSVAIKFLRTELAEDQELAQRFFQEAQAVNRIRHPNIVDVLDAGMSESGPYIVMEHLEGEAVGSALARLGRFEVQAVVATAIPVLEALDAAHRVGIIHRDLKPENVFLAMDAAKNVCLVRLLDFGIAKVLAGGGQGPSPRTRTGIVFGTPDYLSPEQATGEGVLDGRSDLFAVGVLIYELLTGTRPFRAPTAVATAFRVVHSDPPPFASTGVVVPPRLEQIVMRLLEKDPARRYQTAGEVASELERAVPESPLRGNALVRIVHAGRRGRAPGAATPLFAPQSSPSSAAELRNAAAFRGRASSPDLGPSIGQGSLASGAPVSSLASPVAPTRQAGRPSEPGSSPRSDPSAGRGSDPGAARGAEPSTRTLAGARDASARAPQIRPFPARFAGKYQVRGPMLSGVDRALVASFGRAARDEVVRHMPPAYASDFRNDSINAMVAYDLEALDAYMELATLLVLRDAPKWRELGRVAANGEVIPALRSVLRPADSVGTALRRGITAWSRLMSFGVWRVGSSGERAILHLGELDAASLPLRLWLIGLVEETVRVARGVDAKVTITLGEIGFMPDLTLEFATS